MSNKQTQVEPAAGTRRTAREEAKQRQLRAFMQAAILCASSVVIGLGLMEAGAAIIAHLTGDQRAMVFDSLRGWKLLPNITKRALREPQPYLIRTNSRGLRDREYTYEKPAHTFRVIVMGDSQTFGAGGVDAAETFSKVLERSDPRLQVINMGVPAYSTDQEYLYLQSEGIKYHPDLVILAAYENDFSITFDSWDNSIGLPKGYFTPDGGGLRYHPPRASLLYRLSRWSYVSGLSMKRFRTWSRGIGWQPAPDFSRPEKQAIFARLLTGMHAMCKPAGARFLVLYVPFWNQRRRRFMQDTIEETGAADGFATLDLTAQLFAANQVEAAYIAKDIHLNQRGHRAVAQALRDKVEEYIAAGH